MPAAHEEQKPPFYTISSLVADNAPPAVCIALPDSSSARIHAALTDDKRSEFLTRSFKASELVLLCQQRSEAAEPYSRDRMARRG